MIPPDVRLAPQPALIARELSRKIAVRPKDPLLYTCRGVTYAKLGEPAKAIHNVSRAITLDPCSTTAYDFRGSQYAVQRDFTKAMEDFNRALESICASGVYDDRGLLYVMQGESAKALEDFGRAIDVDPDAFDAYIHRGALYRESGNWQAPRTMPGGSCSGFPRSRWVTIPWPLRYAHRATLRESTASGRSRLPRSRPRLATWPGSWRLIPTPLAETEPRPPVVPSWHWRSGLKRRRPAPPERTPRLLDVLAASYAEAGRFAEAFDIAQQAIERAVADGDQSLADEIRGRLQLYKARKPYRVSPPS